MITKDKLKKELENNNFSVTKVCAALKIGTTLFYKYIKEHSLTDYYMQNKKKPIIYSKIDEVKFYLKEGKSLADIGKLIGVSKQSLDYHLGYSTCNELKELREIYSGRLKTKSRR